VTEPRLTEPRDRSGQVGRPRAVVLVANEAAPYSRGLRVARSLAAAGYEVEIAAVTGRDLPDEERDGDVLLRRYRPRGMWARYATGRPAGRSRLGPLARYRDLVVKALAWPVHVRAWWETLRSDLPPADLYHACGILTIGVALALAREARSAGRRGIVVYDVIDVILESNNVADVPALLLAWYRRRERRWVRRADAVVTVNDAIADHLTATWPVRERPTVLLNCQPRWTPPEPRADLIREAAGIPTELKLVLFLGRLGRERGLEEAAEAVLALDDAALVMLGFGPWADRLRERDRDPRYVGRHFTLPPIHPDAVPAWTASADVSIIAVPANSLNQRLSSPNKFWESLTAGTPVVVGRDLEVMRAIVEADRLGATADPSDPADLARALRAVLAQPPADYEAMRARCLAVTRERYNWDTAVEPYLGLVARLGA
jgi:glycosyltransferase involved in cell wall biosynthesis